MTKFETACNESLSSNSKPPSQGQHEDNNIDKEKEELEEEDLEGSIVLSKEPGSESSTLPSPRKEHHKKVEDEKEEDNDGFRTPTSLDHRIPVVAKQCPPAPRKPKPSLKRKASQSSFSSCRHPLDLSKEVELLFPAQQHNQLLSDHSHQSTKKVRREGPL